MAKVERPGKIFVDWSQNARHKTTIGVYSMRARPEPTVSTPVTWDEVEAGAVGDAPIEIRLPRCSGSRRSARRSVRAGADHEAIVAGELIGSAACRGESSVLKHPGGRETLDGLAGGDPAGAEHAEQRQAIARAKLMANAPGNDRLVRCDNATIAPPMPPIVEKPMASARLTWLLTRPSAPSSAYDMAMTVVGLNNKPIPKPPIAQQKNVAHNGQPDASTGTLAPSPTPIANPHRTGGAGRYRDGGRSTIARLSSSTRHR